MTLSLAIKVHDGIVLAADSATTLMGPNGKVVNVFNNANKVFNLYKGLPIGAITWGLGIIGSSSIATIMKDFREKLREGDGADTKWRLDPVSYTIKEVAEKLCRYVFDDLYAEAFGEGKRKPALGFIVGGYQPIDRQAELYRVAVDGPDANGPTVKKLADASQDAFAMWEGEPQAISRLVNGFDPSLPHVLKHNLGVPDEQIGGAMEVIQRAFQSPLLHSAMPIQDTIELAEFLIDLTIKFRRFSGGAPTVGGPIEIAAMTKHEGFKWIRRKHYYSRELNQEG